MPEEIAPAAGTPGVEGGQGGHNSSDFIKGMFDGLPGGSESGSSNGSQQTATEPTPTPTQTPTPPAAPTQTPAPQAPVQPPAAPTPTPALPTQGALTLSPEQLGEILKSVRGPEPTAQVAEPTQEEIDQKFSVVRPNEDDLSLVFRGGPAGVAKMTEMLHGSARMGAMIASHHLLAEMKKQEAKINERLSQFAPAREMAQQAEMNRHTQTFMTTYSHWKPEHVPVLKTVYEKLLAERFNADGKVPPQEVYAKINEEALKLVRAVRPDFAAVGGTGNPGQQPGAVAPTPGSTTTLPASQMTPTPMGGAGGSGGQPGSSNGKKTGPEALFS